MIKTKPKEISLGPSKVRREAIRRQKDENQHKFETNLDYLRKTKGRVGEVVQPVEVLATKMIQVQSQNPHRRKEFRKLPSNLHRYTCPHAPTHTCTHTLNKNNSKTKGRSQT